MNVTGYRLRQALNEWELQRQALAGQFPESLTGFEGEEKPDPVQLALDIGECESVIAKLQTVQARYNLAVNVTVGGVVRTLTEAVKRVGGLGRHAKMWREASVVKRDRWGYDRIGVRNKDQEYCKPRISQADALKYAKAAAKELAKLRAAIAEANATKVDLEVPDGLLLE